MILSNKFTKIYCIGGDGTHRGIYELYKEIARRKLKISIVGIPKTIDNDIMVIDKSFGVETAVEVKILSFYYSQHLFLRKLLRPLIQLMLKPLLLKMELVLSSLWVGVQDLLLCMLVLLIGMSIFVWFLSFHLKLMATMAFWLM